MNFIHDDPDFPGLLAIVSGATNIAPSLVEKDYWVTHTLWALQHQGFELWFKGGTSLSKGFGLIERFSEDLDLRVDPGGVRSVPAVNNWKSEGAKATAVKSAYFTALARDILVPGAVVVVDPTRVDRSLRSGEFQVQYPSVHLGALKPPMRPFVLLEVGYARVAPFVERDLSSFVHDHLHATEQHRGFVDNRPRALRCVHPLVTLLEKLDAIGRRFLRDDVEPATFVRHYEDIYRIIKALDGLPALSRTPAELATEMVGQRQLRQLPDGADPGFTVADSPRWRAVSSAHSDIQLMFWGQRHSLATCCSVIDAWITANLPNP